MESGNATSNKKKKQYSNKYTQSLPVLSSAFAAILTEGKTVREMEIMSFFFAAVANDIFLIAAASDKKDVLSETLPFI